MMTDELKKKVSQAVKLLQVCYKSAGEPLEIAYSGGKDSDVILELAKMAGIEYRAIYKNTTIDPPGTIKHCKDNNVEIVRKKETFFHVLATRGMSNRNHRICCHVFKEYKIMDNVVMGVRRCESEKRKKLYSEPTQCRFYNKKKEHVNAIYPLLDWTNEDELAFINERKIKLHPLYYREDGTVDITRRLGCLCCPLKYYKGRLKEFEKYPNMVKAYVRSCYLFLHTHPNALEKYRNPYRYFVMNTFFNSYDDFVYDTGGVFGDDDIDYKKYIEDYFHITLPDYYGTETSFRRGRL